MQYEWDDAKREEKPAQTRGLDFADADAVYENRHKFTLPMTRRGEARQQDIALVKMAR